METLPQGGDALIGHRPKAFALAMQKLRNPLLIAATVFLSGGLTLSLAGILAAL